MHITFISYVMLKKLFRTEIEKLKLNIKVNLKADKIKKRNTTQILNNKY